MKRLLGNLQHGLLFVISAPAGTGKSTLAHLLVNEFPSVLESISFTTRQPRPGEIDGIHYHFISEEQFLDKVAKGDFLEYAKIYGCYYGTSKSWVQEQLKKGKHLLLVIDTQGGLQIKKQLPAILIFIHPPSLQELKLRLKKRKTETDEEINVRLQWSEKEIHDSRHYDYAIVNDDLEVAYQVLKSILIAEEHRQEHLLDQSN